MNKEKKDNRNPWGLYNCVYKTEVQLNAFKNVALLVVEIKQNEKTSYLET
jgi:hypothetical protein